MKKTILLAKIEHKLELYVPFGILILAGELRKNGYNVILYHGNLKEFYKKFDEIDKQDLNFVGFSTMTGPQLRPTISASEYVKSSNIKVIWGGIHATILPEVCLKEKCVDYVVLGYAEGQIKNIANILAKEESLEEHPGVGYVGKNNEIIISDEILFETNVDEFLPALDMIDLKPYYQKMEDSVRVLPMISSRGCPFACGFCYNQAVNSGKWVGYSDDKVLQLVDYLKEEYKIDGIYFHDDNFFTKVGRAQNIIKSIDLPWFAEMRANLLTQEFVSFLEQTRCRKVFIGAETGSPEVMKDIGKGIGVRDVENAVIRLKDSDIHTELSFIIGFPDETQKQMEETMGFIDHLDRIGHNRLRCAVKVYNPQPNTPLWERALENGMEPPETNEGWSDFSRNKCFLVNKHTKTIEDISKIHYYMVYFPFLKLEKWRWEKRYFKHTYDVKIIDRVYKYLTETKKGVEIKRKLKPLIKLLRKKGF